jgi:hypothetical protein
MNRSKLLVALVALLCSGVILVGSAQDELTIDATKQPSPPARGRGPFPGSTAPGHSAGLPIRLDLLIPTGELRPDGTVLVDFMITNVGTEPITLPSSVDQNMERTAVLTLWLTSDAIKDAFLRDIKSGRPIKTEMVGTSAELYSRGDDPQSFHVLARNKTIRVHASSRVGLNPGTRSFTGHAELLRVTVDLNINSPAHDTVNETSKEVGTADSEAVTKTLSTAYPTTR